VQDAVDAPYSGRKRGGVGDIATVDLDSGFFEPLAAVVRVNERARPLTQRLEQVGHVAANEPGGAGHEHRHW
jgi:hypothetical protein